MPDGFVHDGGGIHTEQQKKESLSNEKKNTPSKNVKHFSDWFSCVFTVCVCCGAHWENCSKLYTYIHRIVSYRRILCV